MPGLGRSPGEGNGTPLQYSCLENPMDRGAWRAAVHGVAKSWTRLSSSFQAYLLLWRVDYLQLGTILYVWASLVAQTVKCLSAIQETWVRSLGREDPLEKEMAPHSSTLAWKIPWTEEPGRLQSMGSQRIGHD